MKFLEQDIIYFVIGLILVLLFSTAATVLDLKFRVKTIEQKLEEPEPKPDYIDKDGVRYYGV